MAVRQRDRRPKRRRRTGFAGARDQTQCRFWRKRSGNCAGCQRKAKRAIKRARLMALLPYAT